MEISNDNLKAIEEIYRALSSISNKLDYGLIEEVEEYFGFKRMSRTWKR